MIKKDYCLFKVIKLHKEKRFNNDYPKGDCTQFACTLQMTMKQLRIKHNILLFLLPLFEYINNI